jgi:adenine-specific DNA-methyltransferase
MAFIVPAEIGHAPYAAPLLDYFVSHFSTVQIVAVREKLFPNLSEDCWLLYADGYGGRATSLQFSAMDKFDPEAARPRHGEKVAVSEWRNIWNRRLRPLLLPKAARDLYRMAAEDSGSRRFGTIANTGIGYVSGANDFFHLRPSEAERLKIPTALLHPAVRNGRALPERRLTLATIEAWHKADAPMMLLRLPKASETRLPAAVRRYLDSDPGMEARGAYKCRVRDPWYSVPDVQTPDYFLAYMSGLKAGLVRNVAGATCTNSVHGVRVRDKTAMSRTVKHWDSDFLAVSREIEGHPLGGGMLKLEPGEASRILIPSDAFLTQLEGSVMANAVSTMRRWRHYAGH